MPTTTRPYGMRAELRNWFFNDEEFFWEGDVYDDKGEEFSDGKLTKIFTRNVKEVREYKDLIIIETVGYGSFYAFYSTQQKKPGG